MALKIKAVWIQSVKKDTLIGITREKKWEIYNDKIIFCFWKIIL